MKSVREIKNYREELREAIEVESIEVRKEILRDEVFTLDRVLGMFNKGVPLTQFEIFELLQNEQRKEISNPDYPADHKEVKIIAAIKSYQWVLGSK